MAHPLIESFLATGRGKFFNPDNAYGYQCKDLIDSYVMHIFPGKSWVDTIRPGDANTILNAANPQYFDKIYNNPNDPNLVPIRGDIIAWAGDSYNPYGHIAIIESADANGVQVLQQDGFLQVAAFSGRLGYSQAGTGMVQGWLRPKLSADLAANQRMVGPANANQRATAATTGKVIRTISANTVETFTGFVRGQEVTLGGVKSNVWFKDSLGYAWAGSFTSQSTSGLKDETPAPKPSANQRYVGKDNVNQRAEANSSGKIIRLITANTLETFTGFVRGESVSGNNIWFKDNAGYAWSGGFTSTSTAGLADLTPAPAIPALKDTQRTAGAAAINQRKLATTSSNIVRVIPAKSVETFTGFVRGEAIDGNNVWFKDALGYAWSGLFESQSTAGLKDETPAPAPEVPAEYITVVKKVVPEGVRLRTLPSTSGDVKGVVTGEVIAGGYVESETVNGSNIWFSLTASGYVHSSGLVDPSVGRLPKGETPTLPVPVVAGKYSFTPDFDFVEYKPAAYENMGDLNFPANPEKLVIHQFDAKAKNPSIEGVISYFQTPRPGNPTSAHFAVSGDRIVQMVSLKDRAFHAGTVGNDYIGIEVDPDEDAATVASVKKLIFALNAKYKKKFEYTKHRDVPGNATECGVDIHLDKYALGVDNIVIKPPVIVVPTPTPVVVKPPVITPPVLDVPTKEEIARVLAYLAQQNG